MATVGDYIIVTSLLPEETLPGGEVGSLEEGVFQDALHAPQGLDHVRAVVVQVPQLPVVSLVGPPERVLLQHLSVGVRVRVSVSVRVSVRVSVSVSV